VTSTIANVVLGLFVPLAIGIFFVMRPLPAALLVAFGGELFLPEGATFKLPFFPILDKHNLPYLCILIGCLLCCPGKVTKLPKEKWFLFLTLLGLVGGAVTGLTNGDVMIFGPLADVVIPAMDFKDGMFVGVTAIFPSCVAFYLGYVLVVGAQDIKKLLVGLGIAGLVYCPFAIIEMRMSPQFHRWIYGYGAGEFAQVIRWGGYRPMVFLPHGLALARFFMATTLALFVLAKTRHRLFGLPTRLLAWFQAIVLVLCRSTGAIVLVLVGGLFVMLFKPKRQLLLASVLALGTVIYPLLRASGIFPVVNLLDAAGALQEDRRGSLAFRFANEDLLLAHARDRLLFGWGTYSRNRVFDAAGRDISVTDGFWIIILGMAGVAGFLVAFGVLLWPVICARRRLRNYGDDQDRRELAGLAIILVLTAVDLIPNGLWCYYPYLLAGALMRRLRELPPTAAPAAREHLARSELPL